MHKLKLKNIFLGHQVFSDVLYSQKCRHISPHVSKQKYGHFQLTCSRKVYCVVWYIQSQSIATARMHV